MLAALLFLEKRLRCSGPYAIIGAITWKGEQRMDQKQWILLIGCSLSIGVLAFSAFVRFGLPSQTSKKKPRGRKGLSWLLWLCGIGIFLLTLFFVMQ